MHVIASQFANWRGNPVDIRAYCWFSDTPWEGFDRMSFYVYILTNRINRVLYTGVTNELNRRIYEHRNHLIKNSFTNQYNVDKLVYFEETSSSRAAIEREKQIKGWSREKKNKLIESKNPKRIDLYESIL